MIGLGHLLRRFSSVLSKIAPYNRPCFSHPRITRSISSRSDSFSIVFIIAPWTSSAAASICLSRKHLASCCRNSCSRWNSAAVSLRNVEASRLNGGCREGGTTCSIQTLLEKALANSRVFIIMGDAIVVASQLSIATSIFFTGYFSSALFVIVLEYNLCAHCRPEPVNEPILNAH